MAGEFAEKTRSILAALQESVWVRNEARGRAPPSRPALMGEGREGGASVGCV